MPAIDLFSKRLFDAAEIRAERLVAILRMVIAASLAIVFFAANINPATDTGASTEITPLLIRQWLYAGGTMAAYFMLGLGSYIANRKEWYRPWMAWLTVSGDCAFLLLNLWLNVTNLGISGAYLIAMPAVWITPVVLAFGTLRFNPWLQGYVVATLMIGIVCIAFAGAGTPIISATDPPPVLGLFFSAPPNIMRLMMLLLAGIVLVVAAVIARQMLTQSINESRQRENLTRYLPEQIAGRLADGGIEELRQGRRQDVAVLFADIRDFTGQSLQMSPEDLGAFVSEFRRRVGLAAHQNGGVIDKFIGDAAMVIFGLNAETEDARRKAASAAIHCATAIYEDIKNWSEDRISAGMNPVRIGVGVHYGEAYCGAIGDADRLEFTVLGDTVNVAAMLESFTKTATSPIAISKAVLEQSGVSASDWRALGPQQLKSHDTPIDIFGRPITEQ